MHLGLITNPEMARETEYVCETLQRSGYRLRCHRRGVGKLVPPKLSLTDVLDLLRKRLVEQQAKGVTVAQMQEVLNAGSIDITERSLRTFLTKGVLPGRKVAEAARAIVSEEGSDPF